MLNKHRKGFVISSAIVSLALYTFVVLLVLIFFTQFKYHVSLEIKDEYRWNKVQVVPMNLLTIDVGNESFVSRMNKAHYGFADETQLLDETHDMLNKQLYYGLTPGTYPFGYVISISNKTISETQFSGCKCKLVNLRWRCSNDCAFSKKGNLCEKWVLGNRLPAPEKCFEVGTVYYKASYPFPLTFNGTDKFIDIMSYEIVEHK